jgi:hypothetical protein
VIAEAIADALKEWPELRRDLPALFKAVGHAYPFGARKHEPYEVWIDELRRARLSLEHEGEPLSRHCLACGATPGRACRPQHEADTLHAERELATQHAPRSEARRIARLIVHSIRRTPPADLPLARTS